MPIRYGGNAAITCRGAIGPLEHPRADLQEPATAKPGPAPTLYCSFCGKGQHEVRKMIAGPAVCICNECIEDCAKIVAGEPSPE
jgi:hypothetical protein